MTTVLSFLPPALVHTLGWTLAHFIWQGLLVGVLLAGALRFVNPLHSHLRYRLCWAALGVMALLPLFTATLLYDNRSPLVMVEAASPTIVEAGAASSSVNPLVPDATPVGARAAWSDRLMTAITLWLPYLVAGWGIGVLALSARHLGGWITVQRYKRRGVQRPSADWMNRFHDLCDVMRVTFPVAFIVSKIAQTPMVIGWLRPTVLIPMSALTGLTPGQIDAILAHELAHIRRNDYLMNLIQVVIEILLFYHPVVWWVSEKIRQEREYCCDDLAVALSGDRLQYARALANLESLRASGTILVPAATGGVLLDRIRRLVGEASTRQDRLGSSPTVVAVTLFVILLTGVVAPRSFDTVAAEPQRSPDSEQPGADQSENKLNSDSFTQPGGTKTPGASPRPSPSPDPSPLPSGYPGLIQSAIDSFITREGDGEKTIDLQKQAIQALGQSSDSTGTKALVELARTHSNSEIRKTALFWLSQRHPKEAVTVIEDVLKNSADVDVQKQALFALAQIPSELGIPRLIRAATNSRMDQEVRKQAIFWLSQRRGEGVAYTLDQIYRTERDENIRKQILFGYTQMPEEDGVPRLIAIARTEKDTELRKQAIFWLSQRRSPEIGDVLDQIYRTDPDREIRDKILSGYAQMPKEEGVPRLIAIAKTERDVELRKQAIFWLSQRRSPEVGDVLDQIFRTDRDPEIRERILFGYTQMPEDEGVPRLIDAAKNEKDVELRKKAIFWLGQSNDPRAREALMDILR